MAIIKDTSLLSFILLVLTLGNVATAQPGSAPELVSPPDDATGQPISATFEWNPVEDANRYEIQVATDASFSESSLAFSDTTDSTSITSSQFENSTTYYWRVRGGEYDSFFNLTFWGDWSESRSFTTVLPKVQLTSPENGASGVAKTPTLRWEPVEGAIEYDLQITTSKGDFDQPVVNENNFDATSYDADLQGFTTYYWRVRGDNETGPGEWSDVWSFTTENSGNPLSIRAPSQGDLWKAGNTSSIGWRATNNIQRVTLEYKISDAENWSLIAEDVAASANSYSWDIPDTLAGSAQIRIRSASNNDISSVSTQFSLYPAFVSVQHNFGFNSASSASDYQLIGLPAQTDISVNKLFSGQAGDDWNAYYDNGTQENYMIEFDGSSKFAFQSGRAFFAVSQDPVEIERQASSLQLSEDTTVTIPLHQGWNMIASPYSVSVPWAAVQAQNEISSTLWGFEGQYVEAQKFEAYKGYYLFNEDNLEQLEIPFRPEVSGESKEKRNRTFTNKHNQEQLLTLKLIVDGTESSSVQVGLDPALNNDNEEALYQFAPPGNLQDHKITIRSNRFTGRQAQLAKAIYVDTETEQTVNIKIKSNSETPVKIKAEGTQDFGTKAIMLINRRTSKSYNLKQHPKIQITPEKVRDDFVLIMGNQQNVKDARSKLKPTKASLFQNYPNPFNGQTTIKYSIPEHMGSTEVRLKIYDILGREVYSLVNTEQQPGLYNVHWDGDNNKGRHLASGVYYYRLRMGGKVLTKKLTLIK